MAKRFHLDIPLNRVEGDIEIRVAVEDGVIVDAWSAGTLFRGFERMLVGRGALDGLVVTPRICGICTTTHLLAAAKALDAIAGVTVPDNGIRLRNLALMAEHVQSDVRQTALMFMVDCANPAHCGHPLYEEAVRRFTPVTGETCIDVIRNTRRIIEVIALIGGQWPHSSFMVPGGVTAAPQLPEMMKCSHIIDGYRDWYERAILGSSIERWNSVKSAADLDIWLDEAPSHRDGLVGFLLRFGRTAGLDRLGAGHGSFLACGGIDLPRETTVTGTGGVLLPGGVVAGGVRQAFDQSAIAEQVAASWYEDGAGGLHPFAGETKPYASGREGDKYSWVKAPRYDGRPAETGPLAEVMVAGDPLFVDLVAGTGPNALIRQLARITRPARLLPAMAVWLSEVMATGGQNYYASPGIMPDGEGAGLVEAARGALGHWVRVENGLIAHYQVVTPSCWNGSPRDGDGVRGPWEQALVGTPLADPGNPIEAGHVLRSFDPCMVCAVHVVRDQRRLGTLRMGG